MSRKAAKAAPETAAPVDQDNDGIVDDKDLCPGQPETVNAYRDGDGCPDVIPPKPEFPKIHYAVNSKDAAADGAAAIEQAAGILKQYPALRIRIEGHTDSYGTEAYNLDISKQRAEIVKTWLVQKFSIDPGRIETAGYGMSRPVASFNTREGRLANRRIEFVVIEGWPPQE